MYNTYLSIFFRTSRFCLIAIALCFSASGTFLHATTIVEADQLYNQGEFAKAREAYDALLNDGQVSEALLLRLAQMAQKEGDIGGCVYYLKRLEQLQGKHINEIRVIQTKLGLPVAAESDPLTGHGPSVGQWLLLLAVVALAGYAAWVLLMSKSAIGLRWRQTAWAAAAIAVVLGGVAAGMVLHQPHKAVVVRPIAAYLQPSYAVPDTAKASSPFTQTVTVVAEQDIWRQVQWGGRLVWLPYFTLRAL